MTHLRLWPSRKTSYKMAHGNIVSGGEADDRPTSGSAGAISFDMHRLAPLQKHDFAVEDSLITAPPATTSEAQEMLGRLECATASRPAHCDSNYGRACGRACGRPPKVGCRCLVCGTFLAVTVLALLVLVTSPPRHGRPGPRLNDSKSTSRRHVEPSKLVVLASTQRGGSTEVAEIVGMHPCGASFNELLVSGHFPAGYPKYKHLEGGIPEALNQQVGGVSWWARSAIVGPHLQHRRWLDDALRVRDLFCSSRPQPVKDHCGNECVVALKMHLNKDISDARDEPWIKLITSPDVGVVVAQRGGVENYCSIAAAEEAKFWGHNPAQCEAASDQCARAAALKHQCNANNSTAANKWSAEIDLRFDVARQELGRAGQLWLDVPFEQFVAEGGGAPRSVLALRVLDHLGLGDPEVWGTCGLPWCANYSWPWPA